MSAVIKGAIAFAGVAGAGGVSYGIYHNITTKPTYAQTLNGTLLDTEGETHKDNWNARLKSLKAVKAPASGLLDSLKTLKSKTESDNLWTELRDWCKGIINSTIKEQTNNEFQNIQNYCTFSIKEKLSNVITKKSGVNDDGEWKVGHTALQQIPNVQLDQKLIEAKGKQAGKDANAAVKSWCEEWLERPFKREDKQEFKNASKICVTS